MVLGLVCYIPLSPPTDSVSYLELAHRHTEKLANSEPDLSGSLLQLLPVHRLPSVFDFPSIARKVDPTLEPDR